MAEAASSLRSDACPHCVHPGVFCRFTWRIDWDSAGLAWHKRHPLSGICHWQHAQQASSGSWRRLQSPPMSVSLSPPHTPHSILD